MEHQSEAIITGADHFLDLVNERGEISISEAANYLKVPKHTIKEWCNTLEDSGLIGTMATIRDNYAVSLASPKSSTVVKSLLLKQLHSLKSHAKSWKEEAHFSRKREIEARLKLLDGKMRGLKALIKTDEEMSRRINAVSAKIEEATELKAQSSKERGELLKEKARLEELKRDIARRESAIARVFSGLAIKTEAVSEKEKMLQAVEKRLSEEKKRIAAEKARLTETRTWLAQQVKSLRNPSRSAVSAP